MDPDVGGVRPTQEPWIEILLEGLSEEVAQEIEDTIHCNIDSGNAKAESWEGDSGFWCVRLEIRQDFFFNYSRTPRWIGNTRAYALWELEWFFENVLHISSALLDYVDPGVEPSMTCRVTETLTLDYELRDEAEEGEEDDPDIPIQISLEGLSREDSRWAVRRISDEFEDDEVVAEYKHDAVCLSINRAYFEEYVTISHMDTFTESQLMKFLNNKLNLGGVLKMYALDDYEEGTRIFVDDCLHGGIALQFSEVEVAPKVSKPVPAWAPTCPTNPETKITANAEDEFYAQFIVDC